VAGEYFTVNANLGPAQKRAAAFALLNFQILFTEAGETSGERCRVTEQLLVFLDDVVLGPVFVDVLLELRAEAPHIGVR
jgi:hypothetical protein